ncbi:hypothetical protein [Enterococcus faecalis]|uniref:hypothetical protein n=1 Tax=Enterococcus faecalis TaxID=1351 RepID=UPI003D0C1018
MISNEKILFLLNHPIISGYMIQIMSNERMYSANFQRYKKMASQEDIDTLLKKMRQPTKELLIELANEVLRVDPQTKSEARRMAENYSRKEG